MNDIELTRLIKNLKWEIDLEKKTCKSELVHYRIIKKKKYVDLKSVWINPEIPPVMTVINEIQRGAVSALREAMEKQ